MENYLMHYGVRRYQNTQLKLAAKESIDNLLRSDGTKVAAATTGTAYLVMYGIDIENKDKH